MSNLRSKLEKDILNGLNESQVEAVTWGEGPLLIIAGAGTGKTKVITHRIAWLIATKRALPEEILGLTFTDKAADEMESRVDILVPYGIAPVWISTFHSFGQRLLREYAFELGIDPNFKILSDAELLVFLKERIFELPLNYFRPLSHPTKYLQSLLNLISRAKDEDVSPSDYLEYANRKLKEATSDIDQEEAIKQLEVANCYQKYEQLLQEAGYVDMPGLITLVLNLLRAKKGVLKKVQSQFKYILVDEFQDTNYAQFQLLKLLAGNFPSITVVGDDDQAIYKFRGACLANILEFKDLYTDAHTIVLTDNYRSTQSILDTARRLILFNNPNRLEVKIGVNKILKAKITSQLSPNGQLNLFEPKVEYKHFDTVGNEADAVAQYIEEKVSSGVCKYSDFAILVRTNSIAEPFLRALNLKAIPWRFSGNQGLYDREEVQILLSLLRILRDINDTQSLYKLLTLYKLNPQDLIKCIGIAHRTKLSLYEVLTEVNNGKIKVSELGKPVIITFLKDIEYFIQLSMKTSAGKVLYEFLTRSGWLNRLVSNPSIENEIRIKNIAQFLNIIEKVSTLIHTDRAPFVIDHIEGLLELGDNPPVAEAEFDIEAVNVLTVHKAKGLEFKVVFMVGLVMDNFPHQRMPSLVELPPDLIKEPIPDLSMNELRLQEERRLFYVGMTRAKQELILTSARDYGGKREKKISQFVIEALDLAKEQVVTQKMPHIQLIKGFAPHGIKAPIAATYSKGILTLSSTAIDDWLTCPQKYWFIHWLRIPTPKHHTMVYGAAVHKAIENYLKSKIGKRRLSCEETLKVFESAWISEGFISREHEEQRFKQGKEVVRKFVEQEEQSNTVPTLVEENFAFLIDITQQQDINISPPIHQIKILGRWDRIDIQTQNAEPTTQNPKGIIIDYKTGDVDTIEKAKQRLRNNIQLPIYALAFLNRFGIMPQKVELRFVDTGITAELTDLEEKIENAKQTIMQVAQGIKNHEFYPHPQYMACDFCPCRTICDYNK